MNTALAITDSLIALADTPARRTLAEDCAQELDRLEVAGMLDNCYRAFAFAEFTDFTNAAPTLFGVALFVRDATPAQLAHDGYCFFMDSEKKESVKYLLYHFDESAGDPVQVYGLPIEYPYVRLHEYAAD